MGFLKSITACLILVVPVPGGAMAQPVSARAQKVDAFGDLRADDAMARLDFFAKALAESPDARGYILGYSQKDFHAGLFLRGLYGYREYLVNSRGIPPGRIEVVAGGNKDKITT